MAADDARAGRIRLPQHKPHPDRVCCRSGDAPEGQEAHCCIDCPSLGFSGTCQSAPDRLARCSYYVREMLD